MKKLTFLLLCLVLGIGLVSAQTTQVTGTVISAEDGEPIIGASIVVKGTTNGTVTDYDGKFSLSVPSSAKTLVISFVGMKTQELGIKQIMKIALEPSNEVLDEVMVVAYGASTKKSFTGSAVKIDGERIARKSPSEISKALQGEVAGVQVINTSGQPGSNATIRIRGIGSVNSSRAPLYVVDGIPYTGDLSGIDPNDIESTTVLKDATATALYGSRAANGVVLLTTKKGKKGKTQVEVDFKYGVNARIIPLYNTMDNAERFVELTWEGLRNKYMYRGSKPQTADVAAQWASEDLFSGDADNGTAGIYPVYNIWNKDGVDLINPQTGKFNAGVNRKFTPEKWNDYIFRNGQKMEGNIKISGGAENITHFTSFGYLKDEGYYIGSDFQRFNARSNIDQNITKWLKTNVNMSYAYMELNKPGQGDNMNNGFQFVNFMPALFPVFDHDADGKVIADPILGGNKYDYGMKEGMGRPYASGVNPAGSLNLDQDKTKSHQFNGNAMAEVKFLEDFTFTANLGVQYLSNDKAELTNPYYGDAEGIGRIYKERVSYLGLTGNQILSWKHSYGSKHNLDAFVAHESTKYEVSEIYGQKSKMARPNNIEWSNAILMDYMESATYGYSMESYFGQLRYDYDEKYFFHGTLRGDGSSRFKKGNKWGVFGSVGAAWAITNESFMEDVEWLKNLKYKLSWGVLGNQDFITSPAIAGYYPYDDLYNIGNLNDEFTFSFAYKGNPDLTWERSSTFNTGIEFDINGVLEGELEYYYKQTKDMLFLKQVSPSLGYAQYPVNDGKMVNQGVEFSLTAHLVKTNDVTFDFRVNGGYYKNKMTMMPIDETTGKEKPLEIQGAYGWSNGHSLYDFYLREYAGVNPETGAAQYNAYYNVLPDGSKDLITDMSNYETTHTIHKLEVEKTESYSNATKKYVGKSAIPALQGGFGFDLSVKGFDLNATFSYGIGGYAYDNVYATLMGDITPGQNNWHNDIEGRWTKPGDITNVPALTSNYDKYANSSSTRFLTKRSYLNLTNLRLGYNLPKNVLKQIKLEGVNIFVSGDNIFYASARKGFVAMSAESGSSDRSQYIPVTTFMGGIKVNF